MTNEGTEPFFGASAPDPVPGGNSGRKDGLLKLLAVIGVLTCLFLAYAVSINQPDSETDAADPEAGVAPTDSTGAAPDGVSAPGPETTGQPTQSSTTTTEETVVADGQSVESAQVRGLLAGDAVIIEGAVPSREVADSLVELMRPLAGPSGVVSELVVDPAAPEVDGVSVAVTDEVVFPPGSDEISPQFFPTLDQMVAVMQFSPNITVVVEGHTDSEGNEVMNLALSQRRAEAVVDYIAANSINRFRLEPRGRGSGEPIADNSTDDGRRRNRRIEFEVNGFGISLDE